MGAVKVFEDCCTSEKLVVYDHGEVDVQDDVVVNGHPE